jgi:hypothetical protein
MYLAYSLFDSFSSADREPLHIPTRGNRFSMVSHSLEGVLQMRRIAGSTRLASDGNRPPPRPERRRRGDRAATVQSHLVERHRGHVGRGQLIDEAVSVGAAAGTDRISGRPARSTLWILSAIIDSRPVSSLNVAILYQNHLLAMTY